ncbi:hypothetical protein OBK20_09895 [Empedobacter falsenii]
MRIEIFLIFILIFIVSCKTEKVDGIIIGETLLVHQSYTENKELKIIIEKCLNKEEDGFKRLNSFNCGGGSGCYELGFVLTQIIYRIGEKNYLIAIKNLDKLTQTQLSSLIRAGLEYGDNDYDNIQDNKKLNVEFPRIYNLTEN